jgi:hypothetical protein
MLSVFEIQLWKRINSAQPIKYQLLFTGHLGNMGMSISFFRLGYMGDDHGAGRKVHRIIREGYQRKLWGKEIRGWEIQTVIS